MKLFLSITFLFIIHHLHPQANKNWSVTKTKLYYDSTLIEIDSGRILSGQKQGIWENYQYSKKGGARKLMSRLIYDNGICLQQTYCSYSPNGSYFCQCDSLGENGRYGMTKYIIDGKVSWEKRLVSDGKLYTKNYYPSGELYGMGHEKTLVLKGKGRCSSDIITSKKIGRWKYYKKNGKRRYLKFFDVN